MLKQHQTRRDIKLDLFDMLNQMKYAENATI